MMSFNDYRDCTFTKEDNILSLYRASDEKVLAFPESDEILKIYEETHNEDKWKSWTNSAGKGDIPPDYFSDNFRLMMEVMRFDDNAFRSGKRNPTLEKETQLLKELAGNEMLNAMPNVESIITIPNTDLPSEEDHNYCRFKDNFIRVICKHSEKVATYRNNHPGYTLVFFVFDETSGVYYESDNKITGRMHFYWADIAFIDQIKESGADFVIWYKPFNAYQTVNGMKDNLPKLIIYDVKAMKVDAEHYDAKLMKSSER